MADQGYQSTSIELSMPHQPLASGDAYIRHFVKTLKTAIETDHSFYPPILIAHGLHALVAQKYVESNPVSALVLVSPFIPEVIQRRFQELSHKLHLKDATATTAATKEIKKDSAASISESAQGDSGLKAEEAATSTSTSASQESSQADDTLKELPDFAFETHADVMAQDGFRERYVLPKKAVYKIDQVAKEHQEKEEAELKKKKETEASSSTAEGDSTQGSSVDETAATANEPASAKETMEASEVLGHDSVPVWETKEARQETPRDLSSSNTTTTTTTEALEDVPVLTVESEASIPSPLEQLPLSIYNTIPPSLFEPTFPILLVTSNGDEIVSTNDVKERHVLAGQVDHIVLEDLDDGGHLIMVSDNAEWEQGIQGITAWLDSNGM